VEELDELPPRLRALVARLPEYIDDARSAQVIRENCFEVADRTLETWLLPTRYINGRAQPATATVALHRPKLPDRVAVPAWRNRDGGTARSGSCNGRI
jgi:hypothetical protein